MGIDSGHGGWAARIMQVLVYHLPIEEEHMAADKQEGALKPVTPTRVAEELRKLSSQRKDGTLDADEYEHRFARMIGELRDRRIDGSRADILATLTPLKDEGIVSVADWHRLTRQLGLA
jgi:hypothetical protein